MSDYYSSLGPQRKALYPVPVWAWVTIAVIIVGIFVLGGVVYDVSTSTTVPNLLGKSRTEAAGLIADAGLTVGRVTLVETDTPAGTVLAQNPAPGAGARKGDPVQLRVAVAIPGIEVPDLRGQDATSAVTAAQAAGLLPVKVSVYSTATVGTVVGVIPAPGTKVPPRGEVTLVVSAGTATKMVTVPNLIGLTSEAATASVSGAGLTPKIVSGFSDTAATGTVIAQQLQAGAAASPGSMCAVLVSKGKAATPVDVPSVVSMTLASAQSAIHAQNLTPVVVYQISSKTAGSVISQFPEQGTASGTGGEVLITVAKAGSTLVSVPNLVGVTQAQAETQLTGLGLVPRAVSSLSSGYAIGTVSEQVPPPGTKIPAGSDVVIGVVKGVPSP